MNFKLKNRKDFLFPGGEMVLPGKGKHATRHSTYPSSFSRGCLEGKWERTLEKQAEARCGDLTVKGQRLA